MTYYKKSGGLHSTIFYLQLILLLPPTRLSQNLTPHSAFMGLFVFRVPHVFPCIILYSLPILQHQLRFSASVQRSSFLYPTRLPQALLSHSVFKGLSSFKVPHVVPGMILYSLTVLLHHFRLLSVFVRALLALFLLLTCLSISINFL